MKALMISAAAAGIAASFAGAAAAGGLSPAPAPVVQPAPVMPALPVTLDWSGPYVGAQLGAANVSGDVDGSGGVAGLFAGYQRDFGRFVLGAQADVAMANLDFDGGAGSIDRLSRLELKAGWDAGRTLIYGTAGLAHASGDIGGVSEDDTGWTAGLGVDYSLSDRTTLGARIAHHSFDDFGGSGTDVRATTLEAVVSFRF